MKLPPPKRLGLPEKFLSWRPEQEEAIRIYSESSERFLCLAMPTGLGKSLTYVGIHCLQPEDHRTLILTSTKALQDQLIADFESIGMRDLRGKSNYKCDAASYGGEMCDPEADRNHYVSVEGGPCHYGFPCDLKDKGCGYFDDERKVRLSRLVVTNYDKWMSTDDHEKSFGRFDLLVLDEGHKAIEHVCKAVGVDLKWSECEKLGIHKPGDADQLTMGEWGRWAKVTLTQLSQHLDRTQESLKASMRPHKDDLEEAKRIKRLVRGLEIVTAAGVSSVGSRWAVDDLKAEIGTTGRMVTVGVRFEPVWPAPFTERMLFRGIPRVVMISATIRPKTPEILGVADEHLRFVEFPSSFPMVRRPIYYIPTVRLSSKSTEKDIRKMVDRGDEIMGTWGRDRSGLIQPVSYARQRQIQTISRHSAMMMCPTARDTRKVIEEFKKRRGNPPTVLNSPAITTGVDFPGPEAEWCWIPKVPFPDIRSNAMKIRAKQDEEYVNYLIAQELVQMTGRGMRSREDRFTCFITDNHIWWFKAANRHLFPKWWIDAFRRSDTVPLPPPVGA